MNSILIITGPSGIGKTYLAQQLVNKYPDKFEPVRLHTTRSSRKSEQFTDRIHITEKEFAERSNRGDFLVADQFHGNWYGYSKSALLNSDKIVIVNTWPALVPRFAHLPNVRLIGLTTSGDNIDLLKKRMANRGDSAKTIHERTKLIRRDIRDLESVGSFINKSGKVFKVLDDKTLHTEVIPWIRLNLLNNS